jgi:long-chain acyl-CoA synthetase
MTMPLMVSAIFETASKTPNKIALVYRSEPVSYEKLAAKICSAANVLQSHGVQRNDCVLLSASSTEPAFVYGYFACHLIGAITVPIDGKINNTTLREIAEQTQPRFSYLSTTPTFELASAPLGSLDCDYPLANDAVVATLDDTADILFTAGTTGTPKGIIQTHRNIQALADGRNFIIGVAARGKLILPLSLAHGFGLGRLRSSMLAGGTIILVDGFTVPERIFRAFQEHDVSGFCCVPSGFATLFQLTGDKLGDYRHRVSYIETATAPLSNSLKERLLRLLPGTRVYNTYGLTETTATIAFVDLRGFRNNDDFPVGKPVSGVEIKIVDDEQEVVPVGVVGQVLVRGPNVMKGYWNDQIRTRSVLLDGWLSTNDIGFLDNNGYLYLRGRKEELINVGGIKVAPIEIERLLDDHPAVKECACIGIDDPSGLTGETIKAFLVAKISQSPKPTNEDLTKFLRSAIESYKIPTHFAWVDELPKSPVGKLQRLKLREPANINVPHQNAIDKPVELVDLIRQIFSLGAETQVTDTDGPGSLDGWDSLGHVKLILVIEGVYGIHIEPSEAMRIETVSDIRAILRNKAESNL